MSEPTRPSTPDVNGQAPSHVVLVRPRHFQPNSSTALDNSFQSIDPSRNPGEIARTAYREVTLLSKALSEVGVTVHLFDDTGDELPDSVFPNNWFSTHANGRIALYPMYSPNRRGERRSDVIDLLRRSYRVAEVTDFSVMEADQMFLEGTGAMVLDHLDHTAYIARSNRAVDGAIRHVCSSLGLEPVVFGTTDRAGEPIYHTNVMMSVATTFALVGLETITDLDERRDVERRLRQSGRVIFELNHHQIANFAGNAIEVQGRDRRYLVLSQRAYESLGASLRTAIRAHCELLPVAVPTIELAGGSVRCMIAGVHLTHRGSVDTPPSVPLPLPEDDDIVLRSDTSPITSPQK